MDDATVDAARVEQLAAALAVERGRVARALDYFRRLEWSQTIVNQRTGFRTSACPWCGGNAPGTPNRTGNGHVPDCGLAAMIADLGGA